MGKKPPYVEKEGVGGFRGRTTGFKTAKGKLNRDVKKNLPDESV